MINGVEHSAFKFELLYLGNSLFKTTLDSLHDCRAYASYFQDNFYGSADVIYYYHNRVVYRGKIQNSSVKKVPVLNPFPIVRDFKRSRDQIKSRILSAYGLKLRYNTQKHSNDIVFA